MCPHGNRVARGIRPRERAVGRREPRGGVDERGCFFCFVFCCVFSWVSKTFFFFVFFLRISRLSEPLSRSSWPRAGRGLLLPAHSGSSKGSSKPRRVFDGVEFFSFNPHQSAAWPFPGPRRPSVPSLPNGRRPPEWRTCREERERELRIGERRMRVKTERELWNPFAFASHPDA